MGVTIPIDSSYVGFCFLVVTELLLIRVVVSAQMRRLDREIKNRLDAGDNVELDFKDFGPLKINPHMGGYKIALLVFPAAITLLLVAVGELGISGRTIPTRSTLDTFKAGSYFELDRVIYSVWRPAPHQFASKWPQCVEYGTSSIVGHVATIPYELQNDTGTITMGDPSCSSTTDVSIMDLGVECYEQSGLLDEEGDRLYFNFNVTQIGGSVYYDSSRSSVLNQRVGDVNITIGDVIVGECSGKEGGPGKILFIETLEYDRSVGEDVVLETYAIIDDSWRLDNERERWIVSTSVPSLRIGQRNTGNGVIIECEYGCLESTIEWAISLGNSVRGATLEESSVFLSIWYEGLNFYDDETPVCDEYISYNWITNDFFSSGDCLDAIGKEYVLDGGEINVTIVSWWAIGVITTGCVFTLMYRFITLEGGYNLVTYEGLAEIYYKEVNPGCIWRKGSGLEVSLVSDVDSSHVSARVSRRTSDLYQEGIAIELKA